MYFGYSLGATWELLFLFCSFGLISIDMSPTSLQNIIGTKSQFYIFLLENKPPPYTRHTHQFAIKSQLIYHMCGRSAWSIQLQGCVTVKEQVISLRVAVKIDTSRTQDGIIWCNNNILYVRMVVSLLWCGPGNTHGFVLPNRMDSCSNANWSRVRIITSILRTYNLTTTAFDRWSLVIN